jgi:hypothetical protein
LRTANGSAIRKRKHVTFQLGDATVVEPSSSYSELASPEEQGLRGRIDEEMSTAVKHSIPPPRTPDVAGGLAVPKGGGASVGFFELDEELDDLDDREIDYHEVSLAISQKASL